MKKMLAVVSMFSFLAVGAVALSSLPALADDEPALADAGSVCSSTDGGAYAVCDLGSRGCFSMAIRCEGSQSTRYKTCATSTCAPSSINQLLDSDRTFDIPVNCSSGHTTKRYLGLTTDDGGVPYCKVQKQP